MPFAIAAKITGLKELVQAMEGLDRKVKTKGLRKAVGAGSKLILWSAKAKAPRSSGLLRRSLGRKIKTYRNTGAVVAVIGPRKGFKQEVSRERAGRLARLFGGKDKVTYADPVRYAHLVELGTSHSRARAFLRPAFEETKGRVQDVMAAELRAVLGR